MVRIRRSKVSKTLKDYLVPLIGVLFIIIIVINSMSGNNKPKSNIWNENTTPIEVNTKNSDTLAYIVYPGDSKKKIDWNISLYKWEKVLVKEGSVALNYLSGIDLVLNRLWELKYQSDWKLSLFSSELWVNSKSNLDIKMRYANVNISENSVLSLSQNEVWSTIYLLSWKVEVSNLVWKNTFLTSWQKITVSRLDASSDKIDLSSQKDNIDNFFKSSDWFIKNSWDLYLLNSNIKEKSKTWSWKISIKNANSLIDITSFKDEERVNSSNIDINWKYVNDNIFLITINGKTAKINDKDKTFSYKGFSLENSINDIIIKIYDSGRNLLWKKLYTLYLWKTKSSASNNSWFKVKTFNLDASGFKFTAPTTSWEYITYTTFVTIKWSVPRWLVSKVVVNDYKLNSFNWVTWRYHARTSYNNLKTWTNIYEIKYYKKDWSLLYKNNYIIIKKVKGKKRKIISDEVKIN